jgi:hypothetical protein
MQHTPDLPSNTGMQRTALCARKILAFLKAGISPTPVPIYECAAADAQTVGRHHFTLASPELLWPIVPF